MSEGYTPERFRPVEDYIKSNKEKLKTRFLHGDLTENITLWGIPRTEYDHMVDEVLDSDASSIAKFMSQYATASMDQRKGAMEKKRQLFLYVQNIVAGNIELP